MCSFRFHIGSNPTNTGVGGGLPFILRGLRRAQGENSFPIARSHPPGTLPPSAHCPRELVLWVLAASIKPQRSFFKGKQRVLSRYKVPSGWGEALPHGISCDRSQPEYSICSCARFTKFSEGVSGSIGLHSFPSRLSAHTFGDRQIL